METKRGAGMVVKRLCDIVASSLLLLGFLVPILILCLLVAIKLGRPVFFRQARPGRGGKPFQMVKFRTMLDARDSSGNMLSDVERMTPFGSRLRSLSLDELPELWNVLKGDMSLVGPRAGQWPKRRRLGRTVRDGRLVRRELESLARREDSLEDGRNGFEPIGGQR